MSDELYVIGFAFIVVIILSAKYALKPIGTQISKGITAVSSDIEDAKRINKESKLLLNKFKTRLDNISKEEHTIISRAKNRELSIIRTHNDNIDAYMQNSMRLAKTELQRKKNNFLQSINKNVLSATTKEIAKNITPKDEVIKEIILNKLSS